MFDDSDDGVKVVYDGGGNRIVKHFVPVKEGNNFGKLNGSISLKGEGIAPLNDSGIDDGAGGEKRTNQSNWNYGLEASHELLKTPRLIMTGNLVSGYSTIASTNTIGDEALTKGHYDRLDVSDYEANVALNFALDHLHKI